MKIGNKSIDLETVDSTNDYLKKLLKSEKPDEGTVVIAKEQIAGRGQMGNTWESNKGENITMSFVLYPNFINVSDQFILSKMVSIAIVDFLKIFIDEVKIKWPNDIYVKNRKIGGVLIENTILGNNISSTVVGIGLNINQKTFSSSLPNPTSLSLETRRDYTISELIDLLLSKLNNGYNELVSGKIKELDVDYLKCLYQNKEMKQYKAGNEIFQAQIIDVDQFGRLCLLNEKKELLYFGFKEVIFI